MNQNIMLRDVIIRAKRPSYEFRNEQRMQCAAISLLSAAVIGLVALGCLVVKSCAPEHLPAYSLCEQCGEIIGAADHGRCQGTEVASCE
jgi:hypothetical protein